MTKDELIALLQRTIDSLKANDSFQGRIAYEVRPGSTFNVDAAVRIGNSQGQGGMIVVQKWDPEEEAGEPCPHVNATDTFCNDCGAFL